MSNICSNDSRRKLILGVVTATVFATAFLALSFSMQDAFAAPKVKPKEVLAQVRDATTHKAEKGASCTFTFQPSATVVGPVTANNGGVAKATGLATDTSVSVSCTDAGGTTGNATADLKKIGTKVVRVLT